MQNLFVVPDIVPNTIYSDLQNMVPGDEKQVKKYEQSDSKGHFFHRCVPDLFSFRSRGRRKYGD